MFVDPQGWVNALSAVAWAGIASGVAAVVIGFIRGVLAEKEES
jgi:hypothetical protein